MKKFLLIACLFITSFYVSAQEGDSALVVRASKPISRELTPQQVIDSLQKRFPNAEAVQYYKTPKEGVVNGWQVTEDGNVSDQNIEYYTLSFKNDKIQYYGLYYADGTLVKSKLAQQEATLPEPVQTTLRSMKATDYKDWKLLSSSYHKTIDYSKHNTYYEVTAAKGDERKLLIMSPDGKVLKMK
jgi:hypothetical protein